jgi:outer membrane receptor protein involved in Fe transport
MNYNRISFASLLACLGLLATGLATGQEKASITGHVTDPSGSTMIGVNITVSNIDTGIKVHVKSNESGYYVAPALEPGSYFITAEFPGFQTFTLGPVILAVAQAARSDIAMIVGAPTQQVTVVAASPLVNVSDSTVATLVENRRIKELPINGRNVFALVLMVPGVRPASGPTSSGFSDRGIALSSVSISGGQIGLNNCIIDGSTNNQPFYGDLNVLPTVDGIEEFKVMSGPLTAQYGFTGGGVLNVVTKSGTNVLHGTAYDFLRNDKLDARNAFSVTRNKLRYNQLGGALGGPVVIPGVYNGRDKSFFFLNYEEWRYGMRTMPIMTVPTAEQVKGDFSNLRDSSGIFIPIYDPATTRVNPSGSGYLRNPFPGNIIPPSSIDPVAAKTLSLLYPLPNRTPSDPFTNSNNYQAGNDQSLGMRQFLTRGDFRLSDRQSLFTRFIYYRHKTDSGAAGSTFPNPVVRDRDDLLQAPNASFGDTYAFTPSLLNELRLGFDRMYFPFIARSFGQDWPQKLGLPASVPRHVLPQIVIENGLSFANFSVALRTTNSLQLADNLTFIKGAHQMKFGIDNQYHQVNNFEWNSSSGVFNFRTLLTSNPQQTSGTGFGMATFVSGAVGSSSITIPVGATYEGYSLSFYAQDDWKVTPRLTLNLGLRYDYQQWPVERYGGSANFNPTAINPDNGLRGRLEFAKFDYGANALSNIKNNFQPRFGFAYRLPGERITAIRGGYAIMGPRIWYRDNYPSTQGFSATTTTYSPPGGNSNLPAFQFSKGFPSAPIQPLGRQLGPSGFLGATIIYDEPNGKLPSVQQWTVALQRELPWGWMIDAAYVGNHGTHLTAGAYDLNQLDPSYQSLGLALQAPVPNPYAGLVSGPLGGTTITRAQSLLPYPYYTSISVRAPHMGNSIYHAFLLTAQKQSSHGLSLLASYTAGKLIDDSVSTPISFGGLEQVGVIGYQNGKFNRAAERSLDPTDVSQRLTINGLYALPFGKGKRFAPSSRVANSIIGGWQIAAIFTSQVGLPLVIRGASNYLADRPNSTGKSAALDGRSASQWFDTSAFVNPPNFTYGNVGRTLPNVRAPGTVNLDLSAIKDTGVGERLRIQFRAETFNAFNHVNLGIPNTTFVPGANGLNRSGTFGTIVSARDPRIVQLGMKLVF